MLHAEIEQQSQIKSTQRAPWSQFAGLLIAAAIFASLSLWGAVASDGFLEADACTHYLYARFAIAEPHYLVNVWGRPLVTGLYAIPAALAGRIGVRITSLLCALAIAAIAYRIAKRQNYRHPELAFIFVLAQPLVFLHSFSELTELPFALVLALAFWAYAARQWLALAILAGLLPLARPEGFLFVLLAAVALIAHRRWWWTFLLPVPLLLWEYAGWLMYGKPAYNPVWPASLQWLLWLKAQWPYAQESAYRPGSVLHFAWFLPAIVGPLIFPALIIGILRSLQIRNSKSEISNFKSAISDHRRRCQLLIALIPLMIFSAHTLLYWRGKMASNGELRYLLTVAVFWGLLAAYGWEWLFDRFRIRGATPIAILASVLPAFVNFYWTVIPLHLSEEWHEVSHFADWYSSDERAKQYPRLLASHPAFFYFMDISPTDGSRTHEWTRKTIAAHPPGTLLVWHHVYAMTNSDRERIIPLEEIEQAGWIPDPRAEEVIGGYGWRIFHSARPISADRTGAN